MTGILLAILVAIIWALGEINYSKISKKYDNSNVYMYTYLLRAIIYISVVLLFKRSLIGTFHKNIFLASLPIILCDLSATLAINVAMTHGKVSIVSPIMASYPVVDILLGALLLKEKTSLLEMILVIIISTCIIVLANHNTKKEKNLHSNKGIVFAVIYMLLAAFSIFFEKSIYIKDYSIYEFYYYKGSIYILTSFFFIINIIVTSKKIKKPNWSIIKGCGLIPIGNVLDSFALTIGNMMLITPISSLYATITHFISRFYLKESITVKEKICVFFIILSTLLLIILKT